MPHAYIITPSRDREIENSLYKLPVGANGADTLYILSVKLYYVKMFSYEVITPRLKVIGLIIHLGS